MGDVHVHDEQTAYASEQKKDPPQRGTRGAWLLSIPVLGYFAWKICDANTRATSDLGLQKPTSSGRKKNTSKPSSSDVNITLVLGVIALLVVIGLVCWFYCRSMQPEMPFDIEAQHPHQHLAPPGMYDHPLARHQRMSRRS